MKRTLLPILAFLCFQLTGQDYTFDIQWNNEAVPETFQGAVFPDADAELPWFSFSLPWEFASQQALLDLSIDLSSSVEQADSLILSCIRSTEPSLKYGIATARKKAVLQARLLPYYVNDDGKVMKIERFTVHVTSEEPIARLKSTIKGSFSSSSVLAEGDWYKVRVYESGMHKLTYEQLLDIGLSNPALVSIYGGGAVQLPEDYSKGSYDDLSPVALYMEKGSDNIFGPGDYILFYGRGPVEWSYNENTGRFEHSLHSYSYYGSYFLTDSKGVAGTAPQASLSDRTATTTVNSYDILAYREKEQYNIIVSGRRWLDDIFSLDLSNNYAFELPGLKTSEPLSITVLVAAQSLVSSYFTVKANTSTLGTISIAETPMSSYTSVQAYDNTKTFSYTPTSEAFTLTLNYTKTDSDSKGWLDYISINGRADLAFQNSQMIFRDIRSRDSGAIAQFSLSDIPDKLKIWEITNEAEPRQVNFSSAGGKASFKIAADSLRTFIAFRSDGTFSTPEWDADGGAKVENQNLHGSSDIDLVIVYNPLFAEDVERLAEHRREYDGLKVLTVTEEQVFNEFSSGTPDVSALRNFMKMYYDRDSISRMPKYLLLFGDGSVDNRNHTDNSTNMILTYQSEESFAPTQSYVSDDFYGLLDSSEQLYGGLLDIGIGRLPVSTVEEATAVVDKLISYDDPAYLGDWRNTLCFIADDEDSNVHLFQANSLASQVESSDPAYNINKIFLDAYPQVSTPTGERYPEVMQAINDQLNQGALIVNYTGHGGINGLAHEQIVTVTSINNWSNTHKLPLFMTATCEFSRYDEYDIDSDQEVTSAGEDVLLNPNGGGIGLFTTTRLVYAGPNHTLNEKFYDIVFEKDSMNNHYRLGDIIVYSKNRAGVSNNKLNFTLLGDPSQMIGYPSYKIVADSINHLSFEDTRDTISALDFATVSGHIETINGDLFTGFNGEVNCVVFDKEKEVQTLANDGGSPISFKTRNSILYRGKCSIENGTFSFGFYVPKDINYSLGYGKLSFYASNSSTDAHGATNNIIIGGEPENYFDDSEAPEINIYMNDTLFKDGGITDPNPSLLIRIKDNYGINTTGNGIGHDLTATLDGDRTNSIILNNYYLSDINSFNGGEAVYPYSDLEDGPHTVDVKVWDIHNNSAEETVSFVVVSSDELVLEDLFSYPNPMHDETFFNITHNRPDETFEVTIDIYSISGEHVKRIETEVYSSGYRLDPVSWDGRSEGGAPLGDGVYIYRVFLQNEAGESVSKAGKLVLIN